MSDPRVTVAIVAHQSAADLPECLEALAAMRSPSLELVVVDCASSDGSLAVARAHRPAGMAARFLALDENLGFAGGMNRAFSASRAPFLLTLNADCVLEPEYVEHLLARFEDRRVGAATGRLLRREGAGGAPRLDACGMRLTPGWRHLDRGSGEPDRGQYDVPESVFGATGAASLFRRRALDDVALDDGAAFAPEFHSFREDAELCFRLQERGWKVAYEPAARARHGRRVVPGRRARLPARVNYHSLKNRYLLRAYHQTGRNLALTLAPALGRDLLALGYVLLRERTSLAAYRWLWRHRREIAGRRRFIQARRTRPPAELDRWFFRSAEPL